MRNLIVLDPTSFSNNLASIEENVSILCLGMEIEEVRSALESVGKSSVEIVSAANYSTSASKSARDYVVANITELPNLITFNTLLDGQIQLNLWHFLLISEKSPIRGDLNERLFFLAEISQVLQRNTFLSVRFCISDTTLLHCLEDVQTKKSAFKFKDSLFFVHAMRYAVQSLGLKIIRRFFKHKNTSTPPQNLIFSLFPYWWLNPLTLRAKDRFFSRRVSQPDDSNLGNLSWLTLPVLEYFRKRKIIQSEVGLVNFHVLQDYVQLRHLRSLFSLKRLFSLVRFRNAVHDAHLPKFFGYDVSSLVSDEVSKSIQSADLQLSILLYLSLREFLQETKTLRIVSRFESQPIDRALIFASEGLTQFVGYWHSTMSMCENYTSLQFPRNFLSGITGDGLVQVGFPRRMLVPNIYCQETLEIIGYDLSLIASVGPTRYLDVIDSVEKRKLREKPKLNNLIGVALSSDPNSCNVMASAMLAIKRTNPSVVFAIKMHPAFSTTDEYLRNLEAKIGGGSIRIISESEDYIEVISECKILILSGTQLAFEGILVETFPVVYEPSSLYCATNFNAFVNSCFIANNVDELALCVSSIFNNTLSAQKKIENWDLVIRKQFGNNLFDSFIDLESALNKI